MTHRSARFGSALALGLAIAAGAGSPAAAKHAAANGMALPFIENDFDGALARAKAAGRPLFVEVWAPW